MPRNPTTVKTDTTSAQAQQEAASDGIENYELPKSLVMRIAKSGLPDNAKLQKDVVVALLKGSTVFINYLAATAHDIASSRQHKSVSASDVLKALEVLQLGDMVEGLQEELQVYRELQKTSKKGKSSSGAADSSRKGKGKEKAAPLPAGAQISPGKRVDAEVLDVDEEMADADADERGEAAGADLDADEGEGEGHFEEEVDEEEEDELADDIDEDEGVEPEPLEDHMLLEEQEHNQDRLRGEPDHEDDDLE